MSNKKLTELLKCPFCGGAPSITDTRISMLSFGVTCRECRAHGPTVSLPNDNLRGLTIEEMDAELDEHARRLWNTRGDAEQRIAELEEENKAKDFDLTRIRKDFRVAWNRIAKLEAGINCAGALALQKASHETIRQVLAETLAAQHGDSNE